MKSDMRVLLTKRLLKEGLLRCMEKQKLEKIKISDICSESGVNRTTFYHHYETPWDILSEIALDYEKDMRLIFNDSVADRKNVYEAAEACCEYLYAHKKEIRILFSENADHILEKFSEEIVMRIITENKTTGKISGLSEDDYTLIMHANAGAVYFFIRQWLVYDIKKTPHEIVELFQKTNTLNIFADIM